MNKQFFILILVIIFASFFRLYNLSGVPVALNGDEAAFGYNAYSILQTGRDEYNKVLPLVFKSFGDYKPPVLIYLLVPFVASLGLTEFSVRLPVALAGIGTVLLIFLISKELFKNSYMAIVSSFFAAISSWAIIFSRGAWEAGIGLFFTTLGVYLFLLSLKKSFFLYFTLASFIVAFYSYHSEKIVVPLLAVGIYFFYHRTLRFSKKKKILILITIIFFSLPALFDITNISGQSRARGSLVTDYLFSSPKETLFDQEKSLISENALLLPLVWHSKIALAFSDIISKIYAYISPANLFVYGDQVGRHSVEDFGVLYSWEFIMILSAICFYFKKEKNSNGKFLIYWLIVGLIPAMITKDTLHTIRPLAALSPLYILEGWGFWQLIVYLRRFGLKVQISFGVITSLLIIVSIHSFLLSYFVYTPIKRADWWQYGSKEMALFVKDHNQKYDKIVIEGMDKYPAVYFNLHIFVLFYQRFDPALYNQYVKREDHPESKSVPVFSFDKYEFRKIDWRKDSKFQKSLLIGPPGSFPQERTNDTFKTVKEIYLPSGEVIFRIVEIL